MNIQDEFVTILINSWAELGICHAVIAPGSRSTPLALGLMRDKRISVHTKLDERSAGYVGLGIGLKTGVPAVVVTTSGTAAISLYPSIAEASLSRVPLIAVTADRPNDLHGVGAPQTLDQDGIFSKFTRWEISWPPATKSDEYAWASLGARSFFEAKYGGEGPGPTHLNLAFREPLLDRDQVSQKTVTVPKFTSSQKSAKLDGADTASLFRAGGKGVFVLSSNCGFEDSSVLIDLANRLSWPVVAELTSGLRNGSQNVIEHADLLMKVREIADDLVPDTIVAFGTQTSSKATNLWMKTCREKGSQIIFVDPFWRFGDPDRIASRFFDCDPDDFIDQVGAIVEKVSDKSVDKGPTSGEGSSWLSSWQKYDQKAEGAIEKALGQSNSLTGPEVARTLYDSLPEGSSVLLASSMPVRDANWFVHAKSGGIETYSNRGANGIDGLISTSIGLSIAQNSIDQRSKGPVAALIGDLAFLHDISGLVQLSGQAGEIPPIVLVVVDNGGGGIFSFLPQAEILEKSEFEALFGTPHNHEIDEIAKGLGHEAVVVNSIDELKEAFSKVFYKEALFQEDLPC
ncbi:MAG: 2-succinyl-5-enolpyruvyl-6-hydroxy-3-cyclohexene-1-carboxylic-acid synthase, partial [Acidimicrobiales bacterium]|nr:2-succinyl-5-enolpyruvyl-6-hydroxy-3-cyclohexene-1-carboxylic-acid synthase [Acidimicrobiales bacterium]